MMPYNLYLEEDLGDDIDIRIQNLDNFYHWCASRMLTLDRKYAKEIYTALVPDSLLRIRTGHR